MRAAQMQKYSKEVQVELNDVKIPEINSREVLVKVKAAGVKNLESKKYVKLYELDRPDNDFDYLFICFVIITIDSIISSTKSKSKSILFSLKNVVIFEITYFFFFSPFL